MTFPANYAVMAEDELTYVTGGGVIADILPPVMTSENWRTFGTNLIKIVGNTFLANFVSAILGTAFGTGYAFGAIGNAMNDKVAGMDFFDTAMQVLGGVATIYTLGTDSADILQKDRPVGIDGVSVLA